jgi:hypothetical protein
MTPYKPKVANRDEQTGRFLTGNNGGGRPKGSRNHLSQAFIDGLCAAYDREGQAAIDKLVKDDPRSFLKLVAALVPQKIESTLQITHELSEEYARAVTYADAWRVAAKARELIGATPLELPVIDIEPERRDCELADDD